MSADLRKNTTATFCWARCISNQSGDFNSAVLLTEKAKNAQIYNKIHLVPFGEYVPLRDSFPLFAWVVGDLVPDDFDFGKEPVLLAMSKKPVKIGPLICFEDTLGDLTRQFALRGAQVLDYNDQRRLVP